VSAPASTRRVLARAVLPAALAAATRHAAPALTARGPLRRAMPRLSGRGRPGGVGLTFDDGPHPSGTPLVLAALAELGWSATFFLLGSEVRRFPDVARAVADAGHEIGLHGDEHRNHLTRSASWVRRDLDRARAEVAAATGRVPRWFRPPYGVLSGGSLRAAGALDLTPVLWTAWGRDWEAIAPRRILGHVLARLDDGGTVLLHDSDCTSARESWRGTVAALPLLAAELDRRGLAVRPLRDHLVRRG
jgi:peptidoglycan/xylan/chitin deacetylase (PgdA/CDA1 family)